MLAGVDIKTVGGGVTHITTEGSATVDSFNPQISGSWGGEFGDGAVTAWGDEDPAGYITFTWGEGKARRIELRVLDGSADDSFNVYVKNPGGNWALVYSYTDTPPALDSEMWFVHDIYSFPAGKGQGPSIDMKIEATGPEWDSFGTYGQLAVDYVEVYDH